MSVQLPPVSLVGAVVGTTGNVDFSRFARTATQDQANAGENGTLVIYSESACGLTVTLDASQWSTFVPAGGWKVFRLGLNDLNFNWQVIYTLANPPVSLLVVMYYQPGEAVDDPGILGNSPIGLSGSVPTSVTQVIQDGQPNGQTIVEATPTASGQNVLITTDGQAKFTKLELLGGPSSSVASTDVESAGLLVVARSPEAGASATGFVFQVWDGASGQNIFGIGSASNTVVATYINNSGQLIIHGSILAIGGVQTIGHFGVPTLAADAIQSVVSSSATTTIASATTPNDGNNHLVRVGLRAYIGSGNTNLGIITGQVSLTDPNLGAVTLTFIANTLNAPLLASPTTYSQNSEIEGIPKTVVCSPNTTVAVKYTNGAAGTISDRVSATIEFID